MDGRFIYTQSRRFGKSQFAALQRDEALARGETVALCSLKPGGVGVHICIVKPFPRAKP